MPTHDDPADWTPARHPFGTQLPEALARTLIRAARSPHTQIGQVARFRAAGGICFACKDTGRVGRGETVYCDCSSGSIARELGEEQARERAAATRQKHVDNLIERAGLTPYAGRSFETWPGTKTKEGRENLAQIQRWGAEWPAVGASLVLWNDHMTGTGKSSLAAALLRERIAATAQPGEFMFAAEMIERLRPNDWQDSALLRRARTAPALVLDDLGTERMTEFVQSRLYLIINGRYAEGLWTVYTTNLAADDPGKGQPHRETLRERIGDRVYWRIREVSRWIEPSRVNFRNR